jgi:hypothetical protein
VLCIAGEVLFDCNYPEDPPDFIFGPEDKDFCPNIENIKVSVDHYFYLNKCLTDLIRCAQILF